MMIEAKHSNSVCLLDCATNMTDIQVYHKSIILFLKSFQICCVGPPVLQAQEEAGDPIFWRESGLTVASLESSRVG